jgi:UrcA family protein
MTSHIVSCTALVVGAIGIAASFAHAATPDADVPSASVSYSDLNLSTEQGSRVLYQRIVSAAQQVCPSSTGPDARQLAKSRQCVADAIERAVSDVKNPKLAAVLAARTL